MSEFKSLIPGVVEWWVSKEHLLDCFGLAAQTVDEFKRGMGERAEGHIRYLAYDGTHTTASACYRTAFGE